MDEAEIFFCTVFSSMEINTTICIHCKIPGKSGKYSMYTYSTHNYLKQWNLSYLLVASNNQQEVEKNQRLYKTLNSQWPLKPLRRTVEKYIQNLNAGLVGSTAVWIPLR